MKIGKTYLKQWNYSVPLLRRRQRKGSLNSKDDYRPMSIFKNLSKIFEKIMYNQMVVFMDNTFLNFN